MIGKKIVILTILAFSVLFICIGSVSAYSGSDGDWQGQLTLTVNPDGSATLIGASVVGGTIEEYQPSVETFGGPQGDCACQDLVMSGSQGYAGAGVVDATGNSAGTQISFTNGNDVTVEQYAGIDVPSPGSGQYGDTPYWGTFATQHVEVGDDWYRYPDSNFETIIASTSVHSADGTSSGVIAQASNRDPENSAEFDVWQDASASRYMPYDLKGTYGERPYAAYTQAYQDGEIEDVSTANIQAYATTAGLSTSGSISVVDGDLEFWEGMDALATEGAGFRGFGTDDTGSRSIALVHAEDVEVNGQSGGSNVVSTYANGDSASVVTSFLMTGGYRNTYSSYYPDLNYNLIGLGVSNDPRSLVWARTNIGERSTYGFGKSDSDDDMYITVGAQNSEGDSAGHTFIDPVRNVGGGTGIIRGNENTLSWARYWPRILSP